MGEDLVDAALSRHDYLPASQAETPDKVQYNEFLSQEAEHSGGRVSQLSAQQVNITTP